MAVTFSETFLNEKPEYLLNRDRELNVGYRISLWESYNYRKAVINITRIFCDRRSVWF